ncbi:hypothetical protein AXK11_07810 [Cephaloticoccus primus]|uniref:DUF481 domain-containing protein n=1 Tax=Cephaloticoccus primus TaxID=1548207 RepID=A0A139SJK9_9BACT|nr:hypothetical protein AXK11_07810 [Cephaloticoccus primus]
MAAAELHLNNGDRLTGTLIERREGKLHFRSALLGDLVIDESAATLVEEPEPAPADEEAAPVPPQVAQAEAAIEAGVEAEAPASPVTAASESAEAASPAEAAGDAAEAAEGVKVPPRVKWSGRFEVALFMQTGRSENNNTSLRVEADRVSRRNNYRFRSRYLYGKSNGRVANDKLSVDLRWRRELSPRIFTQSQTSYQRDRLARIDLSAEQNLSLGYQVLKNQRHDFSVGAGGTGLYRDTVGPARSSLYLAEAFQEYRYKFNKRITISEGLNTLYSPDGRVVGSSTDNAHYKIRFNSALQGQMTDHISLSLRFEYEYDNSIIVPAARRDKRITSSVGYSF